MTISRSTFVILAASALIMATPRAEPVAAAASPWSPAATMAQPHLAANAMVLPNGKVLVIGNFPPQPNNAPELYDPAANTWSPAGTMIVARGLATATLLPTGKVLVAGGIAADTGHSTTRTETYDPQTNSWSPAAGMAVPRSSHTATLLSTGKVLVAGGQNAGGYINTAELYDPASDGWSLVATMDAGYTGSTATLLSSGKVLIAGGATFGDGRAEVFDSATNHWSNAGVAGSIAETATRLKDDRVLITGQAGQATLYDPTANRWAAAANMLQARSGQSATLLPDGTVLVVGGSATIGQQVWLTSAEAYDPGINRWSPAGCLGEARWEHTATLLPTNRVLIAGGGAPSVVASAEIFDPSGAPTSQPVERCPTNPSAGSSRQMPGASAPAAPASPPVIESVPALAAAPVTASARAKPLVTSSDERPVGFSQALAIGMMAGAVLAALGVGFYLWTGRRRGRGI